MIYKTLKKFRSYLLVVLTHKLALPVLKIIRKPEKFLYTTNELRMLSPETLGYNLYKFLEERHLPLLPYYARHDMKHILLDYETTDKGEVCLQCFMLGNRHISFPVFATVLFGLITMPKHWLAFKKAFNRGRKCISISKWNWFKIVESDINELKQKIIV